MRRCLGLSLLLSLGVASTRAFVPAAPAGGPRAAATSTSAAASRAASVGAPRIALAAAGDDDQAPEQPHPRKMDKRWQKKRRRVELGPDGLPVAPIHAPRQQRK